MNSQHYDGHDLVVQWHYNGGTYVLNGSYTNFEMSWSVQSTGDLAGGADRGSWTNPTLEEFSFTLDTWHDGTVSASTIWQYVKPRYEGTIIFGPQGTASNLPKGGGVCYVTEKPLTIPFNDGVSRTVSFTGQGTVLYDPDSDTW